MYYLYMKRVIMSKNRIIIITIKYNRLETEKQYLMLRKNHCCEILTIYSYVFEVRLLGAI